MKTHFTLAAAGALALSACAPTGGIQNNTQGGAIAGAIAGGAIGSRVGERDAGNVAAGALIGAAIGAGVGNILDRQEAELRRELGDGRIGITNTGSQLIVNLPQDILFDVNSSAVRGDLQDDLFDLAGVLRNYPNQTVQVIGHTDSTGDAAFNQDLSESRARAVANILRSAGTGSSQVIATGRGESQPIATNQTPQGRQQNRRVEIVITPAG
ncbi:OmpA family protein [Jannaschia sp. Os4]|uniref:OmpA family protein n=1 Tax=Jannaschia sp. Os4 TaxID=2807617 RepID=UPI001939ECAC|nr:OmpA family protein [Jannaschia sp. Os4]MBM2575071.1 OmpA family protein [Jannaschia sp. Os4]